MSTTVTKTDLAKVVAALKTQTAAWADTHDRIIVRQDGDRWLILWEEGPFEWAYQFPHGGIDEEFGFTIAAVEVPDRVFVEPMTSYSVQVVIW